MLNSVTILKQSLPEALNDVESLFLKYNLDPISRSSMANEFSLSLKSSNLSYRIHHLSAFGLINLNLSGNNVNCQATITDDFHAYYLAKQSNAIEAQQIAKKFLFNHSLFSELKDLKILVQNPDHASIKNAFISQKKPVEEADFYAKIFIDSWAFIQGMQINKDQKEQFTNYKKDEPFLMAPSQNISVKKSPFDYVIYSQATEEIKVVFSGFYKTDDIDLTDAKDAITNLNKRIERQLNRLTEKSNLNMDLSGQLLFLTQTSASI